MAAWIGATSAQRFYQYTLPAAKSALASGGYEAERLRIAALVRKFRADHAKAESPRDRKKANRRIRAQLDEWARICVARENNLKTVAAA